MKQASSDFRSIQPGDVVAGRYQIDRSLSTGGMGSVFVARHLQLGMPVAIKLMSPELAETDEGRSRFEREAKAAALIQSQHVIKVNDYGVDEGGMPYLVMELLEGEDLGARLRRERRLSLAATASIAAQVARGLKRAHEAGVVHRDLKPANIFLTTSDDGELVKILDFGIAKLLNPDVDMASTATGVVLGSFHYMSPEQARGFRGVDHRSDLWSLGVIVYRALTGELPFHGTSPGDLIVKICAEPMPLASQALPDLSGPAGRDLDRFFARALARSPADRFQSATDLAAALAAIAGIDVATVSTATHVRPLPGSSTMDAVTVTNANPSEPAKESAAAAMGEALATVPRAVSAAKEGGMAELALEEAVSDRAPQASSEPPGLDRAGERYGSRGRRRGAWVLAIAFVFVGVAATAAIRLALRAPATAPATIEAPPGPPAPATTAEARRAEVAAPAARPGETMASASASAMAPPAAPASESGEPPGAPSGRRRHAQPSKDRVQRELGF